MQRLGSLALVLAVVSLAPLGQAAILGFEGTLSLKLSDAQPVLVPASGLASVTTDRRVHLLSLALARGVFGPATGTIAIGGTTVGSLRFSGVSNSSGAFGNLSGSGAGGGPMGVSGVLRVCVILSDCSINVRLPLAGFRVGGMRTVPGSIALTLAHSPWTVGRAAVTLHAPNSEVSVASVAGFAHGPASGTSSTAQAGGELQLTPTRVFSSLGAFPETSLFGILRLRLRKPTPPSAPPPGQDRITICHRGKTTMSVSLIALPPHLRHGDRRGACGP